jgi:Zn-dependent M28 family amino/carboxypeptidase
MNHTRHFIICLLLGLGLLASAKISAQNKDSVQIRKIYDYYLTNSTCYGNLEQLCYFVGGRLSGSAEAVKAVEWAKKAMYEAGADTVILQPCMVRHWVRGAKEKVVIYGNVDKSSQALKCIALGNSIGTGPKGIKAPVLEVTSFEELEALGASKVKGKIIFYNVFFDQKKIRPGNAYGETVKYRGSGASQAAKYGALAMVVRSMSSVADDEPHTGNMNYDTSISKVKIPALAISYLAADRLHEAVARNNGTELYIETNCQSFPDAPSFNVVGQITGSEKPNEFLSAGGHLDSWDNGQGAHDDGAGVVQCLELMRLYKRLGIRPKHSIRAVAFMNEENGLAGGKAYAAYATAHHEKHLAALETDAGGYSPRGFNVDTLNGLYSQVERWKDLFAPYLISSITRGGGGADIGPLQKTGVPCMGYEPDTQRYFDIHHTAQDTFDKINKRELELGAAAIGALFYLLDQYYIPTH